MEYSKFFCYTFSGFYDSISKRNICESCVNSLDLYTILNLIKFENHSTVNFDLTYKYENFIVCDMCDYTNLACASYDYLSKCSSCRDYITTMELLINDVNDKVYIINEESEIENK